MPYKPDERERRREADFRRLGTREPRCAQCGEDDPGPLELTPTGIICRECALRSDGKPATEKHHPAGKSNDRMSISIPANDHRVLSDHQRDWPERTLRNDGSPLRLSAALIRGWLSIARLIIDRTLGWVPAFLEWLDDRLRDRIGDRWWDVLGWEGRG